MKPMLAGKFVPEKVMDKFPIYGQPKYDGIRMMIRDGIAYTRAIKQVRSETIQQWVFDHRDLLEGLDGEVICGSPTAPDCYRRTSSSVMSYHKPDDFVFYVFDKWDSVYEYIYRKDDLIDIEDLKIPNLALTPTVLLHSMIELLAYEKSMLEEGHEGIILRAPWAYYKGGRGSPTKCELIKVKQFKDTEAIIVDLHELMHNANEAGVDNLGHTERSSHKENLVPMGTLGAVEAVGHWPDGTEYRVRIGTGFDDAQRAEVWDRRQSYIGRVVKFKYFEIGVKESPRFPVFIGFRDGDDMGAEQTEMF